jgi:hypothetical protein
MKEEIINRLQNLAIEQELNMDGCEDIADVYERHFNPDGAWKRKLIALCEGLEVEHLDDLLRRGKERDYRNIGIIIANTLKKHSNEGNLDPVHFNLMQMIPQLIEEMSGVTDISKGIASKKQRQSATEATILKENK